SAAILYRARAGGNSAALDTRRPPGQVREGDVSAPIEESEAAPFGPANRAQAVPGRSRRPAARDLPGPARDHREGRVGRAYLARAGAALRPARQPPPWRGAPGGVAARPAGRAGGAGRAGSVAVLPPAVCGPAGLGGRAHRRAAPLVAGGHARRAGPSSCGAGAPEAPGEREPRRERD